MTRRVAALAVVLAACRPSGPPPPIPNDMAACVPPGALLVAGARLQELRASPLYRRLPASVHTFLEPYRDASSLLAAFNGAELLFIAQQPSGVKLSGSESLVAAANAQRRSGSPGAPDLMAQASSVAQGHVLWIASRGNVNLPLTGDAANLVRLLRLAAFATVGLQLDPSPRLDLATESATPETATKLEETLRAFLSLSLIGVARQPQLAAMLRSVDVRRDANRVTASLTAPGDAMPQFLDYLSR